MRRSPESVVEEIQYWHKKYGVVDFAFYDDALLVNAENHIIPILEGVMVRVSRLFEDSREPAAVLRDYLDS